MLNVNLLTEVKTLFEYIRIKLKDDREIEGLLVKEELIDNKKFLIIKLENGYNIGINIENIVKKEIYKRKIEKTDKRNNKRSNIKEPIRENKNLIAILHTGGTIASRVDYETNAVKSLFTPEEILERFPEIKNYANIITFLVSNIFSEDINFNIYNKLIDKIRELSNRSIKGIIITHGTDTMHYTSAALKFAIPNVKFPIVLVGSQRSADRPSTDALVNLVCAIKFIVKANLPGVFVCMHGSINDDFCYIFDGFNVRKMHTSRRDAFKQINNLPIAKVFYEEDKIEFLRNTTNNNSYFKKENKWYKFNPRLKIGILYVHPNMHPKEIKCYEDFDGLIIAGTGLGHFPVNTFNEIDNSYLYNELKQLIKKGVIIGIAPQTINGRINLNVYSTGRRLKELGILGNLCDMTIETAFIKLAFLLSNFDKKKVKELYEKNIAGEINERSIYL